MTSILFGNEQRRKRFNFATFDLLCLIAIFGGVYFFSPVLVKKLGLKGYLPFFLACIFDIILLCFLLNRLERQVPVWRKIDIGPLHKNNIFDLLLEIPIYCLIYLVLPCWYRFCENLFPGMREFSGLLIAIEKAPGFEKILLIVYVLILAPTIEEILFRKFIFQLLERINFYFACIAASLFFAICHLSIFPMLALFWLGLCQQFFYCRHGNLSCIIVFHSLYNAIILSLSFS